MRAPTNSIPGLFLLALFAVLYLLPLAARPLFIQDETRYAEVPREMLASGDWVVPRINGVRYFEKPVMGYWFSAASIAVFGENTFGVRFPSALATGLATLFLFFLCRHCYGKKSDLPGLTILIYLTSLGVAVIGSFAVLDPLLTLFLSVTLILFFLASEEHPGSGREHYFLFWAGTFAGCAFLSKGFLAFAVPVLAVAPYLMLRRRWRDLLRMLWLPVAAAALVSLPWAYRIHQREPDFWNYFFWNEHVRRFLSDSAQHSQPFWYFLAILPAMFLPWTFLMPAALAGAWKVEQPDGLEKRVLQFCLCWFLFPFLFFSASSGKLVTYILPCFPPLAVLLACNLQRYLNRGMVRILHWGIGSMVLLAGIGVSGIAGLHMFGPDQFHLYRVSWKWLLLCSCLLNMLLMLLAAFRTNVPQRKIILFALSFVLLLFPVRFFIPAITLSMKAPGDLITRNIGSISPDISVFSGEDIVRAVCWYLKRDDIYMVEGSGELQYGMQYRDAAHRMLTPLELAEFIKDHLGKVVLIAKQEEYSRWYPTLPLPVSVDSNGDNGYLFLRY